MTITIRRDPQARARLDALVRKALALSQSK